MTRAAHNGAVPATATEIGYENEPKRPDREWGRFTSREDATRDGTRGKGARTNRQASHRVSCVRRVSVTKQGSCCEGAVDKHL